ncbi:uncharacterized protein K452DRAFT_48909 [Aplosporella prunicola CBS 121167]|uniref:Uncharacterized protein n=1 Tax=Aplosporella prunicola CBS 121167 TaxID=1176127 RepID=A0A6A6BBJ4_9PEZI|nr:uncharacterized protein K452DRAFT_48909 [Aplosporella prunicola CBS 121167]KAF2140605.1 hypothetical protein K452DRAFT_48909 [Aplosporella prunicola CBS 121167]
MIRLRPGRLALRHRLRGCFGSCKASMALWVRRCHSLGPGQFDRIPSLFGYEDNQACMPVQTAAPDCGRKRHAQARV